MLLGRSGGADGGPGSMVLLLAIRPAGTNELGIKIEVLDREKFAVAMNHPFAGLAFKILHEQITLAQAKMIADDLAKVNEPNHVFLPLTQAVLGRLYHFFEGGPLLFGPGDVEQLAQLSRAKQGSN